jgi:hypothetical protein
MMGDDDQFAASSASEERDMTSSDPDVVIDLADYKRDWEARFGRFSLAEKIRRPKLSAEKALDLIPHDDFTPYPGEPTYLPDCVPTWQNSAFSVIGCSYFGAALAGASAGVHKALRSTGSLPWKLRVNGVLNWSGRYARVMSNGVGGGVLLAYATAMGVEYLRKTADEYNWLPAFGAVGAVLAGRRWGRRYTGGLTHAAAGGVAGVLAGLLFAVSRQLVEEQAIVMPALQRVARTRYGERSDLRYVTNPDYYERRTDHESMYIEGEELQDSFDSGTTLDDDE